MTRLKTVVRVLALAMGLVLSMTACKSYDYYVEQKVNDARGFALDHLRDWSPVKRDYLRYNSPKIMYEKYSGGDFLEKVTLTGGNGFGQICFVWNVPGEELPVIVFGITENGMRGWSPLRLYRRQFRTYDYPREKAISEAVLFAMNNMLYLDNAWLNRVRFSSPRAISTTFPLGLDKRPPAVKAAGRDLSNQVSFVWPSGKSGELIVVSGLCGQNFKDWFAVTALVRPEADVRSHTVTELYSP